MIVCYLDDSGTAEEPILTMAGYIAPKNNWELFESATKLVFDEFQLKEIHAKEFNDTKGDFKGWSQRRKKLFVAKLYAELRKIGAIGIDRGITRAAYKKARIEHGHYPNESRYGNCFVRVIDTIMSSDMMKHQVAEFGATLSFIVERGNKNDADLLRVFNQLKYDLRHVGVVDVMESVTFADKGSTIALQMADFLAFHSRRFKSQCELAKAYLPVNELHRMIFYGVPTSTELYHGYFTNEEIGAGAVDPSLWRNIDPLK